MEDQPGSQTNTWRGGRGWRRGGRGGGQGRGRGGGAPRSSPPPDHFISLRVPSEIAAPYFDAAHAALRSHAGGVLEPYLVGRETAHVTLAVVPLNESGRDSGHEGGGDGNKTTGAAPKISKYAHRPQQRDPLKVEAATRALVAAAKAISEALLEGEGGGTGDEAATTTVASALLSNLSLAPELGTFGGGRGTRVLWLKPDDGVEGRALAAAERAVARALEAEAAVLRPELSSSLSSSSSSSPPAQLFTRT